MAGRTDTTFPQFDTAKLKFSLVTGASAASDMTITGITQADHILFAGHFSTLASIATLVDDTANITITDDDDIQSATDLTDDQLLVIWIDVSA